MLVAIYCGDGYWLDRYGYPVKRRVGMGYGDAFEAVGMYYDELGVSASDCRMILIPKV